MVYFFEMVARLLAFDIGWYVSAIMANLLWIFIVTVLMYMFLEGKRVVKGVVMFFFLAHFWVAAGSLYDISILVAGFLGIYYMTKLGVMMFAESVPSLRRHLILISAVQFYILIVVYNAFIR